MAPATALLSITLVRAHFKKQTLKEASYKGLDAVYKR